jgi:hypothetical protein
MVAASCVVQPLNRQEFLRSIDVGRELVQTQLAATIQFGFCHPNGFSVGVFEHSPFREREEHG